MGANPTTELSFHAEDIPLTDLSPEREHIPSSEYRRNSVEGNYQGFIRPRLEIT